MFEEMKHHKEDLMCYQVTMLKEKPKNLYGNKMVRKKLQVGHGVVLYKSQWKGLLGKWKYINFGPFIMSEVFAGGAVELINPRDACIFVVKGEKLRSYGGSENASEKVSLMLA